MQECSTVILLYVFFIYVKSICTVNLYWNILIFVKQINTTKTKKKYSRCWDAVPLSLPLLVVPDIFLTCHLLPLADWPPVLLPQAWTVWTCPTYLLSPSVSPPQQLTVQNVPFVSEEWWQFIQVSVARKIWWSTLISTCVMHRTSLFTECRTYVYKYLPRQTVYHKTKVFSLKFWKLLPILTMVSYFQCCTLLPLVVFPQVLA